MSHRIRTAPAALAALALCLLAASGAPAAELAPREVLEIFAGDVCLAESYDVSAVVSWKKLLIFGVDEGTALQVLGPDEDGRFVPGRRIELGSGEPGEGETDVEGMARDGDLLWVAGSHSARRKTVKDDKSRKKNRQRLATIEPAPSRDRLIRLRLDPATGEPLGERRELSLRDLFRRDDFLRPFAGVAADQDADPPRPAEPPLPSKDNGIDIEGLAVKDGELFVGFRGPVLRGGYVPVMVLAADWPDPDPDGPPHRLDPPASWELRFVRLGGRGIRSLAEVDDGFLIVAGPVGDSDQSYRLYFWDGGDCVASDKEKDPPCRTADLGGLPTWAGAKAEGLAVLDESAAAYEILVVYDSAPLGLPTVFDVPKP